MKMSSANNSLLTPHFLPQPRPPTLHAGNHTKYQTKIKRSYKRLKRYARPLARRQYP